MIVCGVRECSCLHASIGRLLAFLSPRSTFPAAGLGGKFLGDAQVLAILCGAMTFEEGGQAFWMIESILDEERQEQRQDHEDGYGYAQHDQCVDYNPQDRVEFLFVLLKEPRYPKRYSNEKDERAAAKCSTCHN